MGTNGQGVKQKKNVGRGERGFISRHYPTNAGNENEGTGEGHPHDVQKMGHQTNGGGSTRGERTLAAGGHASTELIAAPKYDLTK